VQLSRHRSSIENSKLKLYVKVQLANIACRINFMFLRCKTCGRAGLGDLVIRDALILLGVN